MQTRAPPERGQVFGRKRSEERILTVSKPRSPMVVLWQHITRNSTKVWRSGRIDAATEAHVIRMAGDVSPKPHLSQARGRATSRSLAHPCARRAGAFRLSEADRRFRRGSGIHSCVAR